MKVDCNLKHWRILDIKASFTPDEIIRLNRLKNVRLADDVKISPTLLLTVARNGHLKLMSPKKNSFLLIPLELCFHHYG